MANVAASLGASLGAGLSQGYSESANSGGAVNSAESYNNSFNQSMNEGWSNSWAMTDAEAARQWSAEQAEIAWNRDMQAMKKQMKFNKEEAQKQRDWQAKMANTIYTRSVANMKKAGINPILAARAGLSAASVGSGASASLAGTPSAPMGQSFMDSWSGSSSYNVGSSYGEGNGASWGNGSSWNAGWSNSEEGIVTALSALGDMADSALAGINSANSLEQLNNMLGGSMATQWGEKIGQGIKDAVHGGMKKIYDKVANVKDKASNKINQGIEDAKKWWNKEGGGGHGF